MRPRRVQRLLQGREVTEGAGVRVRRSLGQSPAARLDPFLLLDEFFSDNPADYLAGFPAHPHRGFETVTYMLQGHMMHQDHLGNHGHLRDGDGQWMTAGRGIVHSEMPQQQSGRMRGFQLWINLPAAEKMQPATYRDVPAEQFPRRVLSSGGEAILLAGRVSIDGDGVSGFFNGLDGLRLSTDPAYLDLRLTAHEESVVELPAAHNVLIYVYEGDISIEGQPVPAGTAAFLGEGDFVHIRASGGSGRLLLLSARPIGEPVVQYGPFVMNTTEEVEQALRDYRDGVLAQP